MTFDVWRLRVVPVSVRWLATTGSPTSVSAVAASAFFNLTKEETRSMKKIMGLITIAVLGIGLTAAVAEEEKTPDATIKLSAGSVAAGVGISWGSGMLSYKGKEYPIAVTGLSVGDVGITKVEASGKVYNLKKIDDFNGNYTAVGAGATVAGGGAVSAMRNQNGVSVELVATTQGVKFALGGGGVDMKIK
jgi:hypothetical protein